MPPSRFGQVSRYRNATLTSAKAHERFTELGLGVLPDNGAGRLLAVTPVSGHVVAKSGLGTSALLVLSPDEPRKFAKQPPVLHGVCPGTLADFDACRFQEEEGSAVIAAGSSQGSLSFLRVTLPLATHGHGTAAIESTEVGNVPHAAGGGPVTAIRFHPTSAPLVLAASNASSKVHLYDTIASHVGSPVLAWDATTPQWDVAWSANGAQVAGAGKDLHVRIWDARQAKQVAAFAAHASKVKPTKVTFISETASNLLLTTGFSQMRQREIAIWDQRNTASPLKRVTLDVASSGLDPVCEEDRGIVYLTAKGDSSIRWIDVGSQDQGSSFAEGTYPLDFAAASSALAPQRKADTGKGEVAGLYVATSATSGGASSSDAIVPCSVQVPRRNYIDFHADLYPDTPERLSRGITPEKWIDHSSDALLKISMDPAIRANMAGRKGASTTSAAAVTTPPSAGEAGSAAAVVGPQNGQVHAGSHSSAAVSATESNPQESRDPSTSTIGKIQQEKLVTPPSLHSESESGATVADSAHGSGPISQKPVRTGSSLVKMHWSRKPMAGSTPLIAAHQNLSGLDISRGPDARMLAVSRRYFYVPLSGPGGRLGVHPMETRGRLPLHMPAFSHGSTLVDFAVDPFNDDQVITIAQDGILRLWRVPSPTQNKDGINELPSLDDEKPKSSVSLPGAPKVAAIVPHPYIGTLVAVMPNDASGSIFLADLTQSSVLATLPSVGSGSFGAAWSPDGSVLAVAGRDKQLHIVDVRTSTSSARILGSVAAHDSPRSFEVVWLDGQHLLTVGHTVGSMRQLKVYNIDARSGALVEIAKENLDASPSILFPFWDADTSVLWLWSKGERIVSAYEIQPAADSVFVQLPAFQHSQPQLGLAFLPKDCVDVRNVELAKALRLSKSELQHVAWNVPRSRPEYFQDDVYPPTVVIRQPLLDAPTWQNGRDVHDIPLQSLRPGDMTALSEAPPPQAKHSSLSKGPTLRQLTAKEREDEALQSVFEKAKGRDEGKDPNHNEDQAARAPDNDDWGDSD